MLSLKTSVELIYIIEKLDDEEIDRIFNVFNLEILLTPTIYERKKTKSKKVNILLTYLKDPKNSGPFTGSFQLDLLQYIVRYHYRDFASHGIEVGNFFRVEFPALMNSLKLDGYTIKENEITKHLPSEIEEAKSESELFVLISKFGFLTAKGHLEQARSNYYQGNWAGANSQFRAFIEALLIDICRILLPSNKCESAASAINLLSNSASPPFLSAKLNEVENSLCDTPFVFGLWKRLHPEGSHPGLSDEEDSTFRYHTVIVFARYLLKRLELRVHPK